MLIAAIRSGDALAGKAVSYSEDDGRFWLTGVGEIDPAKLLEYDAAGQVDWADDATRSWVIELASGESPAPPPRSLPPDRGPRRRLDAAPRGRADHSAAVGADDRRERPLRLGARRRDEGAPRAPDAARRAPSAGSRPRARRRAVCRATTATAVRRGGAHDAPTDVPIAVTAAQNLRRVRQPRPEVRSRARRG